VGIAILGLSPVVPAFAADDPVLNEIVITSHRREQPRLLHAGNIDLIDQSVLGRAQHQHIHELMSRVAGVWVVRGSGQEHQTAIRSPVLSGAGSCGGFLYLEDGIPVRPAGFCTVNQLVEVGSELASSIETIRGPGNALFGSNALHGVVNILMPVPGTSAVPHIALEAGANDFVRVRAAMPFEEQASWLATAVYADDGGFRDDSGYRQGKVHVKRGWSLSDGNIIFGLSATDLQQDSAGFIFGEDAYKDPLLNRSNPTPDAFRDVRSQRLYAIYTRSYLGFDLDVRPYLRHSDMRFMHHQVAGQPIEDNSQASTGFISALTFSEANHRTTVGFDLEWGVADVTQFQAAPAQGPRRQRETRPAGMHYDYEVASVGGALYLQSDYRIGERLSLSGGVRLEYLHYDYRNRMLNGNTRDDGTACGFVGCLYSRPADRKDDFTNLAPNIALSFSLSADTQLYASIGRGFRAPQTTELYRLQNGQQISDLDSEHIDSVETGLRANRSGWSAEIALFYMHKRDSVFRDTDGFNVSGARSRHRGVELSADWQISDAWDWSANASYARHTYDFTLVTGRGENFFAGRDVDTAPRILASMELRFTPSERVRFGVQWTTIGKYFLDAENRFQYPGHALVHFRTGVELLPGLDLNLRLNNITDEAVADRADFGAGDYRYLPGRGREIFVEFRYSPSGGR
jgi:outer membrane receptor protein involved in Fe transport